MPQKARLGARPCGVQAWQEAPENTVPGARLRGCAEGRGAGAPGGQPHLTAGVRGSRRPLTPRLLAGGPRRRWWPGWLLPQTSGGPLSGLAPPPAPRGAPSPSPAGNVPHAGCGAPEKPASQGESSEPRPVPNVPGPGAESSEECGRLFPGREVERVDTTSSGCLAGPCFVTVVNSRLSRMLQGSGWLGGRHEVPST